jgi:hypothetical protein
MGSLLKAAICVVLVAGLSVSAQAAFVNIQNADFESPALGNTWNYWTSLTADQQTAAAWTATGQAALAKAGVPFAAPSGNSTQFAFLQSDAKTPAWATSTITQTATGFTVGASYNVGFQDALLEYSAASNLSVYLDYGLSTQKLLYSTSSVAQNTWTTVSTSEFTAAKSSYALSFVSVDGGALGGASVVCLDNVGFTQTAVPEPGSIALCAAGVIGLLAYAWRKRR